MAHPVIQSSTSILTFQEVVQHLLDIVENEANNLNVRQAIRAVQDAYRDFPLKHQWSYYYRKRMLRTVDSYSTGTVTYDHTGGANERQVTLATGTWPSWAAYGRLIVGEAAYEVESRVSDSVIILEETANPGVDLAAGTAYTICRAEYPLPVDFRRMIQIYDLDEQKSLFIDSESEQHDAETIYYTSPESPRRVTVRGSQKQLGGMSLIFGPPPSDDHGYSMLYEAAPRALRLMEYKTGKVAITSGSATVTGTGTAFPTNCAGAIIRVSDSTAPPTSLAGSPDDYTNPFIFEGVVKSRDSATQLTLTEAATVSDSECSFVLSDPIDIEPHSMRTAFQRLCEAEFERLTRRKTWTMAMADANQAIRLAIENDVRVQPGRLRGFDESGITVTYE